MLNLGLPTSYQLASLCEVKNTYLRTWLSKRKMERSPVSIEFHKHLYMYEECEVSCFIGMWDISSCKTLFYRMWEISSCKTHLFVASTCAIKPQQGSSSANDRRQLWLGAWMARAIHDPTSVTKRRLPPVTDKKIHSLHIAHPIESSWSQQLVKDIWIQRISHKNKQPKSWTWLYHQLSAPWPPSIARFSKIETNQNMAQNRPYSAVSMISWLKLLTARVN